MAKRRCAYTQTEIRDAETGLNMVALVDEGEGGYWPTTYVGDMTYCEGVAKSINEAFGLSEDDVAAIVASSFAASLKSAMQAEPDEPEFIIAFEIDDEYEPESKNHIRAHIFCPHCGAEDTIAEVDVSTRWNRLGELQIDREPLGDLPAGYRWATEYETEMHNAGRLPDAIVVKRTANAQGNPYTHDEADVAVVDRALIWTNASTGDGNYDHDGWICESCLGRSTAPEYFEINDWS